MTSNNNRRNSWIAALIIASPLLWAVPTYFYLSAQTKAINQKCGANIHQIGQALLMYAQNHDGRLPNAKTWVSDLNLRPEVLRCPNDKTNHPVSYAMNSYFSEKKPQQIKDGWNTILLYETTSADANPHGTGADMVKIGKDKSGLGRHNKIGYRFNFFFMANGFIRAPQDVNDYKKLRWK